MALFPACLSIEVVFRDQSGRLEQVLRDVSARSSSLVSDYELIVVDNASTVNFLLQHSHPSISYRHLPASAGFAVAHLTYRGKPCLAPAQSLRAAVDRGMRMLVSTTRAPMPIVTALYMFGAVSYLVYSVYVVAIALFKPDVAPGWVSLSLQQSGMFFLLSLVLLVLGEYIVQMASLSNHGPAYYVAQEFTSERVTRRSKRNIEQFAVASGSGAPVEKNDRAA